MKITKLSMDDILNAKFKKQVFGGVKAADVDEFLNDVMDDYEAFMRQIEELKVKNEELRKENFKVKMNVLKQSTNTVDIDDEMIRPINIEEEATLKTLEKRIIELEKEVAVINVKITR